MFGHGFVQLEPDCTGLHQEARRILDSIAVLIYAQVVSATTAFPSCYLTILVYVWASFSICMRPDCIDGQTSRASHSQLFPAGTVLPGTAQDKLGSCLPFSAFIWLHLAPRAAPKEKMHSRTLLLVLLFQQRAI